MFLNESNIVNEQVEDQDQELVEMSESFISADEAGMMGIVLESQMEFANLTISMIRLEHTAIVSENEQLLESGVGEFFKAIYARLQAGFSKVLKWFQGMWDRIVAMLTNIDTFMKKYGKQLFNLDLGNGFSMQVKEIPSYNMGEVTAAIGEVTSKLMGAKADTKSEEISAIAFQRVLAGKFGVTLSADANMSNGLKEKLRGTAKDVNINGSSVKNYAKFLDGAKAFSTQFNSYKKSVSSLYSQSLKEAKKGESLALKSGNEGEVKAARNRCTAAISSTAAVNQFLAAISSIHIEAITEALKVCRAALAKSSSKKFDKGETGVAVVAQPKKEEKSGTPAIKESASLLDSFSL